MNDKSNSINEDGTKSSPKCFEYIVYLHSFNQACSYVWHQMVVHKCVVANTSVKLPKGLIFLLNITANHF